MRTTTLNEYNAINLVRNGGLDAVGTGIPPFWSLTGASFGEEAGTNFATVKQGETPDSSRGAANYFRTKVRSADPISIDHEFALRFIQPAFATDPGLRHGDENTSFENYFLDDDRIPCDGYRSITEIQLVRGVELTLSFSVRVVFGKAKISARLNYDDRKLEYEEKTLYAALGISGWSRPSVVFKANNRPVRSLSIRIERSGTDLSEVHFGDVMLAAGAYKDLPYTGDPFADSIPKGAIVFAFGTVCPPGFEKVSMATMPSLGRACLKNAASSTLEVEGEETHSHDSAKMEMYPKTNWSKIICNPGREDEWVYPGDDASKAHTHKLEAAIHVPPTRDVLLCRRL